jgi:hypothetical protein
MNIFLFELSENRREYNITTCLIPSEKTEADKEMIDTAMEHLTGLIKEPETGWWALSYHRYVPGDMDVPATHPDAQGYLLDYFCDADGNFTH